MRLCFVEACALAVLRVAQEVESHSKAFGLLGLQKARFGHLGYVIQAPSLRPKASFHTVEFVLFIEAIAKLKQCCAWIFKVAYEAPELFC